MTSTYIVSSDTGQNGSTTTYLNRSVSIVSLSKVATARLISRTRLCIRIDHTGALGLKQRIMTLMLHMY